MKAQGAAVWPVRAGVMPSLADGFCARAETAADLGAALVTGTVVVLAPARVAGERPGGWLESCGKTQLAVCVAESLWQARRLELLIWVTCTKRASVLSGYMEAAAAVMRPPNPMGRRSFRLAHPDVGRRGKPYVAW